MNNLRLFERHSDKRLHKRPSLIMQKQGSKRFALHRGMTNVFSDQTIEDIKNQQSRKDMENNILRTAADFINKKVNTDIKD